MPVLAQVIGNEAGKAWAEICTAQGMQRVLVGGDSSATSPAADSTAGHTLLDHCPFCSLGAHSPALPPAQAVPLVLDLSASDFPERFFSAPHTAHAWCTAQPRAPPART